MRVAKLVKRAPLSHVGFMTWIDRELQTLQAALARPGGAPSSDFDLNGGVPHATVKLTPAAVLIPLLVEEGRLSVVLTRRSKHLKNHPGQIAFPGGRVDESDPSDEAAALREAREEIGLPESSVEIIGALDPHRTGTGFSMRPIVGVITKPFEPVLEPREVDEMFTVPLSFLMNPAHFYVEGRVWKGAHRRYYVVPYGPYYIWGATARILRALADRLEG